MYRLWTVAGKGWDWIERPVFPMNFEKAEMESWPSVESGKLEPYLNFCTCLQVEVGFSPGKMTDG